MTAAKADQQQTGIVGLIALAKKNPVAAVLIVVMSGGSLTGGAAMFGLATKADVQEIKVQVADIKSTVDALAIEAGVNKRLRELHGTAMATNDHRQP